MILFKNNGLNAEFVIGVIYRQTGNHLWGELTKKNCALVKYVPEVECGH